MSPRDGYDRTLVARKENVQVDALRDYYNRQERITAFAGFHERYEANASQENLHSLNPIVHFITSHVKAWALSEKKAKLNLVDYAFTNSTF